MDPIFECFSETKAEKGWILRDLLECFGWERFQTFTYSLRYIYEKTRKHNSRVLMQAFDAQGQTDGMQAGQKSLLDAWNWFG